MPDAAAAGGGRGGAEGGRGGGFGGRGGAPGAGIPGDSYNRPADVTWDRAGNIYVADGFGPNNRIAKFTKDGNFVKSWGQTGSAPGQFNRIRGIASDAAGNIYVADAGNNRIQVFDGEGTVKSQITGIGTPQAICVSGGATQYLYSSNSNDPESMTPATTRPGRRTAVRTRISYQYRRRSKRWLNSRLNRSIADAGPGASVRRPFAG